MKKYLVFIGMALCLSLVFVTTSKTVQTNFADNYIGADKASDRIGGALDFDVSGLDWSWAGSSLNVTVHTTFAGKAGPGKGFDGFTTGNSFPLDGIPYGDLFVGEASSYTPFGSAPYLLDDASSGNKWTHAVAIGTSAAGADNWSNAGGDTSVWALTGLTNDADTYLSDDIITTASWTYRTGQEVMVDRGSATATVVAGLGDSGTWSVGAGTLTFSSDMTGTGLLGKDLAFHWAMGCANDTIEGTSFQQIVPEPGLMLLLGISMVGLAGVGAVRKLKGSKKE